MNINWARIKARRLVELAQKLADKPDHPLAVVWKAEEDEISSLLKHYYWRVDVDGTVKKTQEPKHE